MFLKNLKVIDPYYVLVYNYHNLTILYKFDVTNYISEYRSKHFISSDLKFLRTNEGDYYIIFDRYKLGINVS